MFRLTTESQNSPIHTKAVQVPRNARVPLSSQNSASTAAACSLPASNPTLPASNSTFPVSKATAEPRRWMHKGGNRDPTAFSSLSIISHCSKKESWMYKCESCSSIQNVCLWLFFSLICDGWRHVLLRHVYQRLHDFLSLSVGTQMSRLCSLAYCLPSTQ